MISNKEKNFVSAVIYVYDQEKVIYSFLEKINRALREHFEKYEIICVNDDSKDNTVDEIRRFAKTLSGNIVSVLNMSYYQGLELSMNAGMDLSIGDFVYEFDIISDDYPDDIIFSCYQRSLKGFDIVSVSPKENLQWTSSLFYLLFNKAAHLQYSLRTDYFRVLSRRAINRVHAMSKTIPYRKALYANCGLKMDTLEVEKIQSDRKVLRKSKERLGTAADSIILFTDLAYKSAFAFAAFMMLLTVMIGIYTVGVYVSGKPVEGWTTTMLFLVFGFFGLFVILTMAIKYLSILLRLSFNRQKYIIASIEKLNY